MHFIFLCGVAVRDFCNSDTHDVAESTSFLQLLDKYRKHSFSERDKGDRFERLMQAFLRTAPQYANKFKNVWLWSEFPGKDDLGGTDTGIDLVALTNDGDYWAIQCKCYNEDTSIDKPAVDSFLATSGRRFRGEDLRSTAFAQRLWISTTNSWGANATEAIRNQIPPVSRINLADLCDAPVDWGKLEQGISGENSRRPKKNLRPHQIEALNCAHSYFRSADRGKLIMACGTGKTFVSLRIAENETGGKGLILFLVPSIALLGQTFREWAADAREPLFPICICSDPEVSKKKNKNEDTENISIVDLAWPASTNVDKILGQFERIRSSRNSGMTVVFSTYQSIEVIARAQKELLQSDDGYGIFDMIICDEAHRTTGVTLSNEDESAFVKVHDNGFLKARKRMYMTATPRLYKESVKQDAAKEEVTLCSMDDPDLYGNEIYHIGFGKAVEQGLLTDYKVLILTLNESDVPPAVQNALATRDKNEIDTDDQSKLIGCINALSKKIIGDSGTLKASDPAPMQRAIAFCEKIVTSKKITDAFNNIGEPYLNALSDETEKDMVRVASRHIDGTMTAPARDELVSWLKNSSGDENECRVLTNVRCLSEGVDVPALDAVMFLSARNSEVDVVQSVGRVMRKAPGKKYGYIIIPVLVPSSIEADKALDKNDRYKVVWTVLNALRAHDDRFKATVNKIELNRYRPDQVLVGRPDHIFDLDGNSIAAEPGTDYDGKPDFGTQMTLQFEQIQNVMFARMVQKVGDKRYWEQWAKDVAGIAARQMERINGLIEEKGDHTAAFEQFLLGLQKNINPSITQTQAVEMLSQHIITKPVFEALFEGYSFVKNNPISISMQKMLDMLEAGAIEKDTETLNKFYDSVRMRAKDIDNAEARQTVIVELYDKFFRTAFPKMAEQLGIVYTPVEVVDFIIRSVDDVLQKEFGRRLTDENIHVLDPFTGTGTFITRLLQSGLIEPEDLPRKYKSEIHANEIVLLAYYIAAINIENAYHDALAEAEGEAPGMATATSVAGGAGKAPWTGPNGTSPDGAGPDGLYHSFEGICLTDTFQLGETDASERLISSTFPQNSERVNAQKKAPLRVIIGNPPYSVGQNSANDNAQNQKYEKLDARIAGTYAAETKATNKNSLYDSYIKAIRWSSDRLDKDHGGIIAFVSNGGWLDGNSQNGFRKCLEKEFSKIYVINMRGNGRTSGERCRQEGEPLFAAHGGKGGSLTPITIFILVKNPKNISQKAEIKYHDIGMYLKRKQKLELIKKFGSAGNPGMNWTELAPDEHGDWLNKRNSEFDALIPLGDKDNKSSNTIFVPYYSNGLKTQRDAWCYNSSKISLVNNIKTTLEFYNEQRALFVQLKGQSNSIDVKKVIVYDKPHLISWSRALEGDIQKAKEHRFETGQIVISIYRPFFKQQLYFARSLNEMMYQMPKLFPTPNHNNLVICVSGVSGTKEMSVLISNCIPDLHFNGDTQCFPLYYYEERQKSAISMFDEGTENDYVRRDGVSDFILERARKAYGTSVTKEDIFYYVYGFLHSPGYRQKFANDLKKMLPRLPLVPAKDFWSFSRAGRALAELHLNYESVPPLEGLKVTGKDTGRFEVEKMRFPAKGSKDTIIYNPYITIEGIPARAYEYVVNGKSAIEWIMERYQVTVHKESGIRNDPNDWAREHGKPAYILNLLLGIINMSIQTVDIVSSLPEVDWE